MKSAQETFPLVFFGWVLIAVAATTVLLGGCMAAARHGAHLMDDRAAKQSLADAVKASQEKAISKAQGGEVGILISWNEPKSGLEGTLAWDKAVVLTYSCRRYKQTLSIGNELLSGILSACPQGDGAWRIVTMPDS